MGRDPNMPIPEESQKITKEKIREFLPKGANKIKVTDEAMKLIHNMEEDTGVDQHYFEEKLLSFLFVLGELKTVSLQLYINAVKFCSLKMMMTNEKAWAITFPDRYQKLIDKGASKKDISAHVAMFNGRDIVVRIDTLMMLPDSLVYMPYRHAAIKKQFELINGIAAHPDQMVSPHVQHLAAAKLYEMTAPEKTIKLQHEVTASDPLIEQYSRMNDTLSQIVNKQMSDIKNGVPLSETQKLGLTHGNDDVMDAEYE
jgi:hypothetical protein